MMKNFKSIQTKVNNQPTIDPVPNLSVRCPDNKLIDEIKERNIKLDIIDKIQISKIKQNLYIDNRQKSLDTFIQQIKKYSSVSWVCIKEILLLANRCGVKLDERSFNGFLMRKSLVPGKFPGNLIEKYIVPIFEAPIVEPQKSPDSASFNKIKMKKKAGYKEGKKSKSKLGDYLHPNSQIERMKEEENKKRTIQTEKLIFKISEALFKHGLTITKWLNKGIKENPKTLIRDRVIDGHEYQLIKRDNFIDALEEIGIHTTLRDKDNLKQLLGTTFLDFINLKIVINIFSKLGINEDIPNSTKMLNFEIFNGECIRIYNRIIQCMEKENVKDVDDWLPQEIIEPFQVVSRDKEHQVGTIYVDKFKKFLSEKKIIFNGQELNEFLVEFLELSPYHDHLIMVKKLKKSLEIVKNCEYYRNFGTAKRTGIIHRKCDIHRLFKGLKMTEEEFMVMKQNLKDIDVRKNQLEALRKIVAMWKKNIMRRNSIQDYVEKARSKFKQVLTKNKVINQFKLALDKSEKKKAENPGNNLKPRRYSLKKRSSNKEERRDSIFSIDSQKSEYMDSVAGFSQIGFKGYSIDFLRKRFGLS